MPRAEASWPTVRITRCGLRWQGPSKHSAQGPMAQGRAQREVGPDRFRDLVRVVFLSPQFLDQPLRLGPQGGGFAAGLVTNLQRRRVPQTDRRVAGAGDE